MNGIIFVLSHLVTLFQDDTSFFPKKAPTFTSRDKPKSFLPMKSLHYTTHRDSA